MCGSSGQSSVDGMTAVAPQGEYANSIAVIGDADNKTSRRLVEEWRAIGLAAFLATGLEASTLLGPSDIALGRIDVLRTLDGVDAGLLNLLLLERRGVPVLNPAFGLLAAHDKLRTAHRLSTAGIAHPRTGWVRAATDALPVRPPLVVKPRFGSWGVDVYRCMTERETRARLLDLSDRSWFKRHGALIQELVPTRGRDLRVIVAQGAAVGAIHRVAAPGEWRTNIALGGTVEPAVPGRPAIGLAIAAAEALGCDLAAVDLVETTPDTHTVLELNGAADFDEHYARPGHNVYRDIADALGLRDRSQREATAGRAASLTAALRSAHNG